jgi:hypothetical protein
MPVKVGLQYIEIWKDSMENAVLAYEKEPVITDQIVFYGPSYFTRWSPKYGMRPLREDIVGASGAPCVINRGFGSSCPEHQLYYYSRLIRPLAPRVLVYHSHGNSAAFGYTLEEEWELAQRVIAWTMTDFPNTRIYLVGVNPGKNMDEKHAQTRETYNGWLRAFADAHENCFFIDPMTYPPLLRQDIYTDLVHFNQEGYDLYGEFFRDALKDELAQY